MGNGDSSEGSSQKTQGVFRRINALAELPIQYEDFTLIDIGSGKGRAVLVAADLPFRRIIGVEIATELHEVAARNVERVRPGDGRIELLCQDATAYEFPDEPLVLYLYNPFLPPIMRVVMARLAESLRASPRPAHLIVFAPDDMQQEAVAVGFERADGCTFTWPDYGPMQLVCTLAEQNGP